MLHFQTTAGNTLASKTWIEYNLLIFEVDDIYFFIRWQR